MKKEKQRNAGQTKKEEAASEKIHKKQEVTQRTQTGKDYARSNDKHELTAKK
jgi:hypothetical protein